MLSAKGEKQSMSAGASLSAAAGAGKSSSSSSSSRSRSVSCSPPALVAKHSPSHPRQHAAPHASAWPATKREVVIATAAEYASDAEEAKWLSTNDGIAADEGADLGICAAADLLDIKSDESNVGSNAAQVIYTGQTLRAAFLPSPSSTASSATTATSLAAAAASRLGDAAATNPTLSATLAFGQRYASAFSVAAGTAGKFAATGAQKGFAGAKALAQSKGFIASEEDAGGPSRETGAAQSSVASTRGEAEGEQRSYDAFANDGGHAASDATSGGQGNAVRWSTWDQVVLPNKRVMHFLLIGYQSGKLQMWQQNRHDQRQYAMQEVLRLQPPSLLAPGSSGSASKSGEQEALAAKVISRKEGKELHLLVVLLTRYREAQKTTFELVDWDCASSKVAKRITLSSVSSSVASAATDDFSMLCANLQTSSRYIVISLVDALGTASIRIHDIFTLAEVHAPLQDTAQPFCDRPPAFTLSGRVLAYASTVVQGPAGVESLLSSPQIQHQQIFDVAKKVSGTISQGAWALGSMSAGYIAELSSKSTPSHQQGQQQSQQATEPPSSPASVAEQAQRRHVFTPRSTRVRILDIGGRGGLPPRQLVSFGVDPSSPSALAALKFNDSAELIFAADVVGRMSHVFAIQPSVAAHRKSRNDAAVVRHLYKIKRGITSAQIVGAEWSRDSRLLHVLSKRGTVHTVAINPFGERVDALSVVRGKSRNALAPSPLSSAGDAPALLSAVAHNSIHLAGPSAVMRAREESNDTTGVTSGSAAAWPTCAFLGDSSDGRERQWQVLSFEPITGHALQQTSAITVRQIASQSPDDPSGRFSALTEMLRASKSGSSPRSASLKRPATRLVIAPTNIPDAVSAMWSEVQRQTGSEIVLGMPRISHAGGLATAQAPSSGEVSGAEIETFVRVPRVLASHVYLSHQFHFSSFELGGKKVKDACDAHRATVSNTKVRAQVELRPPADAAKKAEQASSFDDKLIAAIDHPGWDSVTATVIPSFPQGGTGRSPGWSQRAIPIRSVAGGIGGSIKAARSSLGRSVEVARRISSSHDRRKTSSSNALSFDEAIHDDRFFAEAMSADAQKSTSSDSLSQQAFGSSETPLTAVSSDVCADDFDGDDVAWDLARGTAEDVEGDELGWDAFADPEFGGKGLVRLDDTSMRKQSSSPDRAEEFLVGVFDEDTYGNQGGFSSSIATSTIASSSATKQLASSLPATTSTLSARATPVAIPASNAPDKLNILRATNSDAKATSTPSSLSKASDMRTERVKKKKALRS